MAIIKQHTKGAGRHGNAAIRSPFFINNKFKAAVIFINLLFTRKKKWNKMEMNQIPKERKKDEDEEDGEGGGGGAPQRVVGAIWMAGTPSLSDISNDKFNGGPCNSTRTST